MKSGELTTRRLHEVLAQEIEDLILSGTYGPGEVLPSARELAQNYGVSQTVVRDAIRSLAGKGLVTVRQGVGTFVAKEAHSGLLEAFRWALRHSRVTRQEVGELVRILVNEAATLATSHRTAEDLAELERIVGELAALGPSATWEQVHACDLDFHLALARAAHNRALETVLRPLFELYGGAQLEGPVAAPALVLERHERILALLRAD
jgi:GntR family transcriptional repressor for pyruvate dehydrogenase complex